MTSDSGTPENDLDSLLSLALEKCQGCRKCAKECDFLMHFGSPGEIAGGLRAGSLSPETLPWLCSLCGLCGSVCKRGLNPGLLFDLLRRERVKEGKGPHPEHRALMDYEKRGVSPRYTLYYLPRGAKRVFFPGCALPGIRPHTTYKVYELLKNTEPATGIVLDCCTKPSKLLGRMEFFMAMMQELVSYLKDMGVREMLFACPNCYQTFGDFGPGLALTTVYEAINEENDLLPDLSGGSPVSVHDPCVLRFDGRVHDAVRETCSRIGLYLVEMKHSRARTLCCGEGGGAGFVARELADSWRQKRVEEAAGRTILTYCAGCLARLNRETRCLHLLDLVVGEGENTKKIPRSPVTYLNRLRLKKKILKQAGEGTFRERPRIVL